MSEKETTENAATAHVPPPLVGSASDTPRTDREAKDVDRFGFTLETVRARFSREMERELYQCQKDRQREHNLRCRLAGELETLRTVLERLLNTSAVVSSDEDFTEITCVNRHYEAAYEAIRDIPPKRTRHGLAMPPPGMSAYDQWASSNTISQNCD